MATVLNVVLYLLLASSLVGFVVILATMVWTEPNRWEQALQVMCLVAGAIIALGAHSADVGIATYLIDSLTGARPAGAAAATFAVVVPGGIAAALGWYFLHSVKKSTAKAMRIIAFLGMLTVVTFIQIFATATEVNGFELGKAAIPNASFVAGLILSIAFLDGESGSRRFRDRVRDAASEVVNKKAPKAASFLDDRDGREVVPTQNPFAADPRRDPSGSENKVPTESATKG